jgi:anthranilate phosphoribosyltransferase
MSLRTAVDAAVAGREVPAAALEAAFGEIMAGKASETMITALLVALHIKGETVGEIVAAARALRAKAVTAPGVDPRTVDTCGTGGDGAATFNISTAAAFAVAGAGVPVAKHGNRAASSQTGSVDVLEALGVCVDLAVEQSARILREVGIALFFAPRAHPAMRFVAPVRRELGFRTLMNCLPRPSSSRSPTRWVSSARSAPSPFTAAMGWTRSPPWDAPRRRSLRMARSGG